MKRLEEGLTIVELLVAISIISVVFVVLASSQVLGLRTTSETIQRSAARDLATEKMEVIRSYGYTYYQGCPGTEPSAMATLKKIAASSDIPQCSGTDNPTSPKAFSNLTVTWQVTNAPTGVRVLNPPALVGVTVRVQQRNRTDAAPYTLSSYLSCADAGDLSVTSIYCPEGSLQ